MKKILILLKASIKRNKLSVLISVLCAATVIFFINSYSSSSNDLEKIKIGIIDNDSSSVLSEDFKSYLRDDLGYKLVEDDYDALSSQLILRKISVIIEIPEDFYSSAIDGHTKNTQLIAMNDYENKAFTKAYVDSYMKSINTISNSADGNKDTFKKILDSKKNLTTHIVINEGYGADTEKELQEDYFEDFVGMFLFLSLAACMFIGFTVFDDRASGTFNRIKIAPFNSVQYILGVTLFGIVQMMMIVVSLCLFLKIKGMFIGMSIGLLFVSMTLISLFLVGLSVVIALICKSRSSIMTFITGFSTFSSMLGGAFFPIDKVSKTLQNISKITPQYWFMSIIRNYQATNKVNPTTNIIVLILFVVLIYLIAAVLFAQKKMYKN